MQPTQPYSDRMAELVDIVSGMDVTIIRSTEPWDVLATCQACTDVPDPCAPGPGEAHVIVAYCPPGYPGRVFREPIGFCCLRRFLRWYEEYGIHCWVEIPAMVGE